MQFSP
jgi:hypothetical protein